MASNYKRLGNYIQQVDVRNTDLSVELLLGVSIEKKFIESHANTVGTDFSKYKIVKRGQFAYGPVTSRNGDKISIALLDEADACLISSSYTPFEIVKPDELNAEYLMMLFRNPEYDRFARYNSWGSAREVFSWEDFCDSELYIPDIEEQQKIVRQYKTITDRIEVLEKINEKLESIAKLSFKELIFDKKEDMPDGWNIVELQEICDIKGGKRLPAGEELQDVKTEHPYIRVRDVGLNRYTCLTSDYQYISDDIHKQIARYIVNTDDVIISIVGTIGLIGKIHSSLNKANLTENCMRMTNLKCLTPDFIYYTLACLIENNGLNDRIVGAVQAKLPMYNIQTIPVIIPDENTINEFTHLMNGINETVESQSIEIQKLYDFRKELLVKLF